jgi:hypothetical protein
VFTALIHVNSLIYCYSPIEGYAETIVLNGLDGSIEPIDEIFFKAQ